MLDYSPYDLTQFPFIRMCIGLQTFPVTHFPTTHFITIVDEWQNRNGLTVERYPKATRNRWRNNHNHSNYLFGKLFCKHHQKPAHVIRHWTGPNRDVLGFLLSAPPPGVVVPTIILIGWKFSTAYGNDKIVAKVFFAVFTIFIG